MCMRREWREGETERERDRQTETERNVHEERMKGGRERERELPTYVRIHIKKNRRSVHVHTHTAQTTQTATPNTLLTGTEGGPYQRVYPCKAGPIQGTTTWQSTYLEHIKIIERWKQFEQRPVTSKSGHGQHVGCILGNQHSFTTLRLRQKMMIINSWGNQRQKEG